MIQVQNEQQLSLFQTPFDQGLDVNNRWVRLAHLMPWDELAHIYYQKLDADQGTPSKAARLILGAVIIKHKENLKDEGTIEMIKENVYMQYFVGLSSFRSKKIFEPSLFVAIRKRLDSRFWNKLNEIIIAAAAVAMAVPLSVSVFTADVVLKKVMCRVMALISPSGLIEPLRSCLSCLYNA